MILRNVIFALVSCFLPLFAYSESSQNNSIQQHPYYQNSNMSAPQSSPMIVGHSNYSDEMNNYSSSDYNGNDYQPYDPCCPSNGCWDYVKFPLLLGVTAVAAGAIGAALVNGNRGHGHHGND